MEIEPVIFNLFFVLLGALASWLITRYYYFRSTRDQRIVFDKLSFDIKDAILNDNREKLSVQELNDLLKTKVIDENDLGPLPYKKCPVCGSENIIRGIDHDVEVDAGDFGEPIYAVTPFKTIKCDKCGWNEDETDKTHKFDNMPF